MADLKRQINEEDTIAKGGPGNDEVKMITLQEQLKSTEETVQVEGKAREALAD